MVENCKNCTKDELVLLVDAIGDEMWYEESAWYNAEATIKKMQAEKAKGEKMLKAWQKHCKSEKKARNCGKKKTRRWPTRLGQ